MTFSKRGAVIGAILAALCAALVIHEKEDFLSLGLSGSTLFYVALALAILIFTVILRALQFPLQIKSQKSMAGSMRLQKKQQEIQEKYGKDRDKVNEEL